MLFLLSKKFVKIFLTGPLCLVFFGCGYHWGHSKRALPHGYKTVFVKQFDNTSHETGIEAFFTNALIREFRRSGFTFVTNRESAELIIEGTIISVEYQGQSSRAFSKSSLFTEYLVQMTSTILARRSTDNEIIWQTTLRGNKNYLAPVLATEGLRSSNPLYNQSARELTIKKIAQDMMNDAFDQITETF